MGCVALWSMTAETTCSVKVLFFFGHRMNYSITIRIVSRMYWIFLFAFYIQNYALTIIYTLMIKLPEYSCREGWPA